MSMEKMPISRIENAEEAEKVAETAEAEKPLKDAAQEKGFFKRDTVNGVEFIVGWNKEYDDYTIYFPQIELGEKASDEKGIYDQMIRIAKNPDVAKLVFDYTRQLAKKEPDVYKIYQKVESFSRDLSSEDEK